jgi:hypothetical protein
MLLSLREERRVAKEYRGQALIVLLSVENGKEVGLFGCELKMACPTLQTIFLFVYSQKRFCQASLLISTKYFQNSIIIFCLDL